MVEKNSKPKNTKQRGSRSGPRSKFDNKDSSSKGASSAPMKIQDVKPGNIKSSTISSSDVRIDVEPFPPQVNKR